LSERLWQFVHRLEVQTHGKGLYEITPQIAKWIGQTHVRTGLVTVFIQHTSASLVIQENADPDVRTDLKAFFERLVPEDDPMYLHTSEGPDDMPSHVRSALTQVHLSIPVAQGRMALGTWQGIYVFEHRSAAQLRSVALHIIG
jgi:secondary thiamine-phosphate synthase enzyme